MRFIIYKDFEILFQGEFDGESFIYNEIKWVTESMFLKFLKPHGRISINNCTLIQL